MTIEEAKEIMEKPKSITYLNQYRKIYELIHNKKAPAGCGGCKLTWLYQSLKNKINRL